MKKRLSVRMIIWVLLLSCGQIPNAFAKPNQKLLDAALMRAVVAGETQKARLLLKQGASVNAAHEDGVTPLLAASYVDESPYQEGPPHSLALFKLLLAHGAHVNAKNHTGVTPLMVAAGTNSFDAVKLLLERGAQVNAADVEGRTTLMRAAYSQGEGESYSSPEIIEILLSHGADINAKTPSGETALILATQFDWFQKDVAVGTVKLLLANGADVNSRTKNGNTALKWARMNGHTKIIRMLQNAGARG